MRGDEEMGTIVAAQIVEEEGTSGDGDTNTSGESGSGESGGAWEYRKHGETVLEVHQAPSTMHRAHMMQELPSEALWVFAHAAEGGHGRQRWTIRVPTYKGDSGESDEGGFEEGQEGHHIM